MEFKLWPWDFDEKPYWVNPENGIEWYIDKETTKWCSRDDFNDTPKLNAIVFIVAERKDGKLNAISRVLLDKDTNKVLADETSLEALAVKIDILRLAKSY